ARYVADAWRGRVYAVRYFLTFITSGIAVQLIARLYGRGGFDLVLAAIALAGVVMMAGGFGVAAARHGARGGRPAGEPAEWGVGTLRCVSIMWTGGVGKVAYHSRDMSAGLARLLPSHMRGRVGRALRSTAWAKAHDRQRLLRGSSMRLCPPYGFGG